MSCSLLILYVLGGARSRVARYFSPHAASNRCRGQVAAPARAVRSPGAHEPKLLGWGRCVSECTGTGAWGCCAAVCVKRRSRDRQGNVKGTVRIRPGCVQVRQGPGNRRQPSHHHHGSITAHPATSRSITVHLAAHREHNTPTTRPITPTAPARAAHPAPDRTSPAPNPDRANPRRGQRAQRAQPPPRHGTCRDPPHHANSTTARAARPATTPDQSGVVARRANAPRTSSQPPNHQPETNRNEPTRTVAEPDERAPAREERRGLLTPTPTAPSLG